MMFCCHVQRQIAEARSRHTSPGSATSTSSSSSVSKYSDLRSERVRSLVQPGDEDLVITPDPGVAQIRTGVAIGEAMKGKKCDKCQGEFHSLLSCSGCKTVRYCGQECQKAHWKAQHRHDCARMKADRAEKSGAAS